MAKIGKDWQRLAKIGKDWQRLAKIGKDWQRLAKIGKDWQRLAKIGKMWDKQTVAKSGIKFTLAFSGKYWHKKSDKMRVRKPYGKKWQNTAQANYGNEWYKL